MTMMTDLLPYFGSPTMKSIEMSVQSRQLAEWEKVVVNPKVSLSSPLFLWKLSHSATKVRMSFFMPSRKK